MKQHYLLFPVVFLLSYTVCAQDSAHELLSFNLHKNIKPYIKKTNSAYEKGDVASGQILFESLVQSHLIGTKFDNFSFKRVNQKKLHLNTLKKPIYLLTYSSWCIPSKGEIPALNKLAKKYEKDIQIVVVFWDRKNDMKKMAQKFSWRIEVCYAHETYNKDAYLVATLKHTFGLPTTFLIDENMNVVNIKRGNSNPGPKISFADAFNLSFNQFQESINTLLLNERTSRSRGRLATH
ncbi:TlpA family protein disulfide reductase [Flavobacterium suncheonense]|uniref:TlpA family protein disulfide reductase n=1 Tax=Flavobacterium suncheonense TaxID=350894 RepID=UPI003FA36F7C